MFLVGSLLACKERFEVKECGLQNNREEEKVINSYGKAVRPTDQ